MDGEDWGPGENKMYLGARYFAARPGVYKPDYAILLDMIGQKDLHGPPGARVAGAAPGTQRQGLVRPPPLWVIQAQFPDSLQGGIGDDHVAFNNNGIPAIDLIDFDYPYWHTLQDTADKCSPQSLKAVGDVMAKVVMDEK